MTTFDERALETLPEATGSTAPQRRRALELFNAMPVPSQETEEWRYTDLSDFELDFRPYSEGFHGDEPARGSRRAPAETGPGQDRAGLLIQHNSTTTIAHLDPTSPDALHFESLDAAMRDHPEIVEPYLHTLVPADRTKFYGAPCRVPHRRNVRPSSPEARRSSPIQTLTPGRGRRGDLPAHPLIVEPGSRSRSSTGTSPDLGRAFSDASSRSSSGTAPTSGTSRSRSGGAGHPPGIQRATVGRDATFRSLNMGSARPSHAPKPRRSRRARRVLRDALGTLRRRGPALRSPLDPGPRRSELHQRPPLQGALRTAAAPSTAAGVHVRPDAQKTNAMQTPRNIVLSEHAKADAIPNLEIEENDVRCGHAASVGPVDEDAIFYSRAEGSRATRPSA